MNLLKEDVISFVNNFDFRSENVEVGVASQAIHLHLLENGNFLKGSQNCYHKDQGAFTGELSPASLKDMEVNFSLVGHSERRQYFKEETDELIEKTKSALKSGLKVVFCIGESLDQFESRKTNEVIKEQLNSLLSTFKSSDDILIAYEPVWAIGTGKVATIETIKEVTEFISSLLAEHNLNYPILYGGSVKPQNSSEIAQIESVQGVLVGGASLQAENFMKICSTFDS